MTLKEPGSVLATTKEPVTVPFVIMQVWDATGLPDNVQLVSFVEKSEPETLTVDPNSAELESKEMEGPVVVFV